MHRTRVITGIIGLALLVLVISQGNALLFWLVTSAAIVVGLSEFYQFAAARDFPTYRLPGLLSGWLLSCSAFVAGFLERVTLYQFTLSLILLSLFLYALFSKRALSEAIPSLAITLFGVLYVSGLLSHLVLLRDLPNGRQFVFYVLLVVWAGDTGAYYLGRWLGKHPLAPVISPKKTIEGGLGGVAASLAASLIIKLTFLPVLNYRDAIVLGILLAIVAQLGDLCESMLKRGVNVKDSGTILPGHGGILDRLDGVMFAAPVLYYYLLIYVTR